MGELLLLAFVALVVFGPERLPGVARQVGKAMRSFQRETARAAAELQAVADLKADDAEAGVLDRPAPSTDRPAPARPSTSARPDGDPATLEDT